MATISQATFQDAFSWMKMQEFRLGFQVWINNIPALVQTMAWHQPGDKPLSEPMMFYLTDPYMRHSASMSLQNPAGQAWVSEIVFNLNIQRDWSFMVKNNQRVGW